MAFSKLLIDFRAIDSLKKIGLHIRGSFLQERSCTFSLTWALICLFLFAGIGSLSAQEVDSLSQDTTIVKPPPRYNMGVFGVASIRNGPNFGGRNFERELGLSFSFERLSFSIYDVGFLGSVQSTVIFPNVFELDYSYQYASLGFAFLSKEHLRSYLSLGYGQGSMNWSSTNFEADFLEDRFDFSQIAVEIEWNRLRFVVPRIAVGYQQFNNLILTGIDAGRFDGIYLRFGLKLGYNNQ
ncbi:MAG: hypothetical protein AAF789_12180 [Bacteroidota bacterium]